MLLLGCDDNVKTGPTHINGKIINPKTSYVVLTNYDDFRDTLQLDARNNFGATYTNFKSGLYNISYPGEYQSFYIETGDSLGMRANTKAFDETLAFTGSHSKENDYLINLFGNIEASNMRLLKYKNTDPAKFYQHVDKIRKKRLRKLEKASGHHNFNDEFIAITQDIINLNGYYELERYPIVKDVNPYSSGTKFPKEFFKHRDAVNINKTTLLNNYAYRPFINALVSNLALKKMSKKGASEINLHSYDYNKHRLIIIDSIFKNEQLQNYFAAAEIRNFIRGRKNAEEINKLVSDFLEVSSNPRLNKNIAEMAATYVNLDPGNAIPNFLLKNKNNNTVMLKEQVEKLSVLYFWSMNDRNYALGVHDQVADLQNKYPEIEFIGINIDDASYDQWQEVIATNDLKNTEEFQIISKSVLDRQLALRNSNRSMVVSQDMVIIDPNINLFHYKIETTLLGYLNQ